MKRLRRFALLVMFLSGLDSVAAVVPLPPESVEIRREYSDLVEAPLGELLLTQAATHAGAATSSLIRVSTQASDRHAYLIFVPERDGEFPVYAAGTYILRRSLSNGEIDQLKVFLHSDPRFFVRIWPESGERSSMSVFLAGVETHTRVPVPMSIPTIMHESLAHLLDVTKTRIDWGLFFPPIEASSFSAVARMAIRATSTLHTLPDAEDGAMDEEGRLVFIESLVLQDQQPGFNCSGFAKWIVDGLHMPLFGEFLSIETLKTKHLDLRGHRWSSPREDDRDPYFGLDWTP